MKVFEALESNVRSYCRSFPTVFTRAAGCRIEDRRGRDYVDFFAGAGALNYGHNPPPLKSRLLDYIESDGITHGLDMATEAKEEFLRRFHETILRPRKLPYKVMFPGPTGTNAVEAAVKLARKVTERSNVVAFTNAFHGMTLGSLSLTANESKRQGAGIPLENTVRMPYANYLGEEVDTIDWMRRLFSDPSSGIEPPAAIIVETLQAEGGVRTASPSWLRRLARLAREIQALLIVDDIQVGCGRTGPFFSFETAGIQPDIVCLSKSLSGYGLPLAVVLLQKEIDLWDPGEHNGTFRGNNPAFVTATAALECYWEKGDLPVRVKKKSALLRERLEDIAEPYGGEVRGRGLLQGIEFEEAAMASEISKAAFERGLICETSGPRDEVLKIMPPLVIQEEEMDEGLQILEESVYDVLGPACSPAAAAAL